MDDDLKRELLERLKSIEVRLDALDTAKAS